MVARHGAIVVALELTFHALANIEERMGRWKLQSVRGLANRRVAWPTYTRIADRIAPRPAPPLL